MQDYSSAKIELLALKWSVCEKFKDYLLGSKFTVYMENNPLVYVKTSKLGAAQIRCLSELALYDFDIVMILILYTVPAKVIWSLTHYHGGQNLLPVTTEEERITAMRNGKLYHIPSPIPENFTVTITPYQVRLYNPRGNAQCERFNRMMFGLLHMLSKEQKADWPVHLPSLVFAYNVTPHSTTGFQPYQLMFGRKAPAPCDNWLGLGKYDDQKSVSKTQWVDQMAEKLLVANKRAMKNIKAAAAKNKRTTGGLDIDIPPGNLVLLRDHPEGRNKIQDHYKSNLFKVVKIGERLNNFWIKPLGSSGHPKEVNRRQLFDIGITEEGLAGRREEEDQEKEEEEPAIPKFNPQPAKLSPIRPGHSYNLRPRPKPAPRKLVRKVETSTSTLVTHL